MIPVYTFILYFQTTMGDILFPSINDSSSFNQYARNVSSRNTSGENVLQVLVLIEVYFMPVICTFGLTGNTLSAITFFRAPLRKTSCSVYLGVRSISDNGFLLALLLIWVSTVFDLRLSQVRGVCQSVVFLTYICGCVSIWLVVFVTMETYVRICHPFVMKTVCSKRPARILTTALCVFSFGVYNFPLWISNPDCSHNRRYSGLTQALVYIDTLLTLAIPSLIITILMTAIVYSLILTYQRRQRLNREPKKGSSKSHSPAAVKVTKMLFIVSLLYFVLNIPSHVIRFEILANNFIKGRNQISYAEKILQSAFQILYYLSLAVNIIIYLKFGRNFRKSFKSMFGLRRLRTDITKEAINMVNRSHTQGRRSLTVIIGSKPTYYTTLPSSDSTNSPSPQHKTSSSDNF